MAGESTTDSSQQRELEALADAVSAIHEELCAVQPESAQCVMAGSVLACVMTGGLTPIERTLIERDRHDEAREYREAVIDAESARLQEAVEAGLHRRVTSRVHVFDPVNAVTTLVYVLEPPLAADDERRAIRAWASQVRSQSERHRAAQQRLRETQHRLAAEIGQTREHRTHPEE